MRILRVLDDLAAVSSLVAVLDTAYDRHCQRKANAARELRDERIAALEKRIAELESKAGGSVTP